MTMVGGMDTLSNYPKSKVFSLQITSKLRQNPNRHPLHQNPTQRKNNHKITKKSKKRELTGSKTNSKRSLKVL